MPPAPTALVPARPFTLAELPALRWTPAEARAVGRLLGSYLDIAGTAMGRATYYNTRAEQVAAEDAVHASLFALSRELYGKLATLPGVTDTTRMRTALRLLAAPATELPDEGAVLRSIADSLPAPRLLRLMDELRLARVNHARARRFLLRSLLGSDKLELWSVKYRRKMGRALRHAWGVRLAGVLRSILAKADVTPHEERLLRREIDRYSSVPAAAARECVGFIFSLEADLKLDLTRRYRDAKEDLNAGRGLPPEVLEGIRATYHKHKPAGRVLELARSAMTAVQRMRVQRSAEVAGVKVAFDPRKVDAVRLYVYAFERGMDDSIANALDAKASAVADTLPFEFGHAGILVDASASMAGSSEQAMRPIAAALAVRDLLQAKAERASTIVCGGRDEGRLVRPEGATRLARGLVQLMRLDPDVLFILTDGYENAPAGRFDETLGAIRDLGIETPVYQISPVFGAEADGLRAIAPGGAPALPLAAPKSFGLAFVRGLVENDPKKGIRALLRG